LIQALAGTSLIEYPGRVSSIIFIAGCNLFCPFCHNPELVRPDLLSREYALGIDDALRELTRREGFIEAVSITGGEPFLYEGLGELLRRIRLETGLLVKVDTNGTFPDRLISLLSMIDYVAMDIKTSPLRYRAATGDRASFEDIRDSIAVLRGMSNCEFRTTMVPGLVECDDVLKLLEEAGGVRKYVLQGFRSTKTLAPEFAGLAPYPRDYLEAIAKKVLELGLAEEVELRV
jgi:pyruvate formate lyase activating enzyme